MPTFLVDTNSDTREIKRAIRGLRAVQKMGRLAERVLAELEEKGHYDGRAPWLAPAHYGRKYHVKYSRFPSLPEVSRSTVPDYGPVSLIPGYSVSLRSHGSVEYECLDVRIRVAKPAGLGFSMADVGIGYIKMNSGSAAFNAAHHDKDERSRSVTLLRSPRRSDLVAIAKAVAENAAGPGFKRDPLPAVYYSRLCDWLVKDGHALAFLGDLRRRADEHRLARRILHE